MFTQERELLYTRSQGYEFADSDKAVGKFLKAEVDREEAERSEAVDNKFSNCLLDLTKRASGLMKGLCTLGETKEADDFIAAIKRLTKPSLLETNFKADKDLSSLGKSLEDLAADFHRGKEIASGIEAAEAALNGVGKLCDSCKKPCASYQAFTLSCGHILDKSCFGR